MELSELQTKITVSPGARLAASLKASQAARSSTGKAAVAQPTATATRNVDSSNYWSIGAASSSSSSCDAAASSEVAALPADPAMHAAENSHHHRSGTIARMLARCAARHQAAEERYAAATGDAKARAEAMVAAAGAALNDALKRSDADFDARMLRLEDPKTAVALSASDVDAAWAASETEAPRRAAALGGFGKGLEAAEAARLGGARAAIAELGDAIEAAGHLDAGQRRKLLEDAALEVDAALLADRQQAAGVLMALHAAEADAARRRRQRWEEARSGWRALRCERAAAECAGRLAGEERFAREPAEQLKLFSPLRAAQEASASALAEHFARLPVLLAPGSTQQQQQQQSVLEWCARGGALCDEWDASIHEHMAALERQEAATEATTEAALAALSAELGGYITAADAQTKIETEARPAAAARRAAAQSLLERVGVFARARAAEWRGKFDAVSGWLAAVAACFEERQQRAASVDRESQSALSEVHQASDRENAEREQAFAAAVAAIAAAPDVSELNAATQAALAILEAIAAGHRTRCAGSVAVASQRKAAAAELVAWHRQALSALLRGGDASGGGGDGGGAVAEADGGEMGDLLVARLLDGDKGKAVEPASEAAALAGDAKPATDAIAPAATAESAPAAMPKASPGQNNNKQAGGAKPKTLTAAEAAKAAAEAAEAAAVLDAQAAAAAAAAAVAAEAQAKQAAAAARSPLAADGSPLLAETPLPSDELRAALRGLAAALLSDADDFDVWVVASASAWAAATEAAATAALNAQLHAHRPRAWRVEETDRSARAAELETQERRLARRAAEHTRALARQQAAADAELDALRVKAAEWAKKVESYGPALDRAQAARGVDACWREAQLCHERRGAELAQAAGTLRSKLAAACGAVKAATARFRTEQLRGFDAGGRVAPGTAAAHGAALDALDAAADSQAAAQAAAVDAAEQECARALQAALSRVEALLPAHRDDLAFAAAVAAALAPARACAAKMAADSAAGAAGVEGALRRVERLVDFGDGGALFGGGGSGIPLDSQQQHANNDEQEVPARPGARAAALLRAAEALRQRLARRGEELGCLAAPGALSAAPLDVALECLRSEMGACGSGESAEPAPDAATAAAVATNSRPTNAAAAQKPSAGDGAKKTSSSSSSGGNAQKRPDSAAARAAAAAAGPPPPPGSAVAEFVRIARACGAAVDAAARAFYGRRDPSRESTRPDRAPATARALLDATTAELAVLRKSVEACAAAAAVESRLQAARAARLAERLPAAVAGALATHLESAAAVEASALASALAAERQNFAAALESHKRALHPALLRPGRRADLESLKSGEAARGAAAVVAAERAAADATALAARQRSTARVALHELVCKLLQLLDGFLLPADLVPPPPSDDSSAAAGGEGTVRRDLRQLERLQLALELAQPLPGDATPSVPAVASAGGGPTNKAAAPAAAASSKHSAAGANSGKGGKPLAAEEAASQAAAAAGGGRPFGVATWLLPDATEAGQPAQVSGLDSPPARACVRAHGAALAGVCAALDAAAQAGAAKAAEWGAQERRLAAAWQSMVEGLEDV